jgi:hypothetical protein
MNQKAPEELEELLRERSEQYLLYPSDTVWSNINKELHPNRSWIYVSIIVLLFLGSTTAVMLKNQEKGSWLNDRSLFTMRPFIVPTPSEKLALNTLFEPESDPVKQNTIGKPLSVKHELVTMTTPLKSVMIREEEIIKKDLLIPYNDISSLPALDKNVNFPALDGIKDVKKGILASTLDNIIDQARKIGKNAKWQIYVTPTLGYRKLDGKASSLAYNYSSFSLSTNAMFARDVNDAVSHSPGMGFEVGTAMYYPLTKRLTFKAGLQANYNHYQINAYESVPEIANYGINNLSYGGIPISAVSTYSSTDGYSKATLRNEHYMISIPFGLDYRVAGNQKFNFSVASTLQPTYVFTNYSYLISTNLRNYAKEPSLNRNWNINSAFEANFNFEKGDFKWSVGPQFRYQLFSSFKDKYPISENLMDFGVKVGVIKTIK